ncbi:MAG: glycoside hydrolase [Bacteroidales bacterium]|nr:glycoside hydrolase [Bacteroidales bacterium]
MKIKWIDKLCFCLFLTALMAIFTATAAIPQKALDVTQKGNAYTKYWSFCVGAGRANEGLRVGWMEQLKQAKENCGFRYVRMHGLFHDDMCVYTEKKGQPPVYSWMYIDELFDRMLQQGVRPFIELSFFPSKMAGKNPETGVSKTQFWWKASITPPEKFDKWEGLVKAFTQHCVDRYGINEVLSWYFEVWNEPNLDHVFFDGDKSQYFELYKVSVNAVRSVDGRLKVGGPATSNFVPDARFDGERENVKGINEIFSTPDLNTLNWHAVWVEDFLKYCQKENLPVDFVSCHPYPTDYAFNPNTGKGEGRTRKVFATFRDMSWLSNVVKKSAYPKAEIHLTEWSSSPSSRDRNHDMLHVAAYIIKVNLDCIGLANSLSYWTFTDVFEEVNNAGVSIFHGGFGMINFQGLVKPSYHAYRMLNALGDEILYREEGKFISRNSRTKKVSSLLYYYPEEMKEAIPDRGDEEVAASYGFPAKKFTLALKNLKPGAVFKVEILDEASGNVYKNWKDMGSPEPPTREQIKKLRLSAENLQTETLKVDSKGMLVWEKALKPWSCVLITEK